jgi:hypothetical protein
MGIIGLKSAANAMFADKVRLSQSISLERLPNSFSTTSSTATTSIPIPQEKGLGPTYYPAKNGPDGRKGKNPDFA